MALDIGVVAMVLLAAVLHATWNALVKAGGDRLAVMALTMGLPALPCALALPFVAPPLPASWPFLFGSIVVHTAYFASLVYAYRLGDLSQVYPIARGAAPVAVALGAWLLAGEQLSLREAAGVLAVSGGIASLAWRDGAFGRGGGAPAVALALTTACAIGVYSIMDGLGVRRAGGSAGYILWLFALEGLPFAAVVLWRRRGRLRDAFGPSLRPGIGAALISTLAYGIVIWAMSVAPLAQVAALRETSVVMAAAIGALFLDEPFGRRRIAAATVVALGAVLLQAG